MNVEVPEKLLPLYTTDKRFIRIRGGRGSAKSRTVADFLLVKGLEKQRRFLCTREFQGSIRESVHQLLSDSIMRLQLPYKVTDHAITSPNGSEFIFKGLWNNYSSIKGIEGIDLCWVEESQAVSKTSLEYLIPTIRKPGSQIIFTYNPTNDTDPVHIDYDPLKRSDVLDIEVNYCDNPFFPDVLRQEMEYDRSNDPDKYAHIWMGQCVAHSDAQVFYGKWAIEEFETPVDVHFYYGADWGFSKDPSTLVRCFVKDKKLFIDYDVYGIGVDIDKLPDLFALVPESRRYIITSDNARPETISYLRQHGYPRIRGAQKPKGKDGSIKDGVAHIRSYDRVVIHPRCKHTIDEFRLYSYVVDKLSGQITDKIEDKHNHIIDALRYALEDIMMRSGGGPIKMSTATGSY
jgi:phage terminase large subunit